MTEAEASNEPAQDIKDSDVKLVSGIDFLALSVEKEPVQWATRLYKGFPSIHVPITCSSVE